MAAKTSPKTLYLVDGTAQLFRAYFAIGGLTNADGLPTNAVYGFTTMLRKLLNEERPPYVGVAFDMPGPVFRHESYAEYKANRPPAPEDLNVQVPYAKQICEALGVPILELQGYEADDLIATCAAKAHAAGFDVVLVAADKDLLQLVGEGITLLNPAKNVRLDAGGVTQSFGVPPDRVRDVLGLMGDAVDNVPGVPGVGQKTALSIVKTYGDVEAAIGRAERFVAAYDARDRFIAALDSAGQETVLAETTSSRLAGIATELTQALECLLAVERDAGLHERLANAVQLLTRAELDRLARQAAGQPGRRAIKPLGPLKRELKALDRGSSKRVWYSIAEHAEQARLSKELVTLHTEVPVDFLPERFEQTAADRSKAHGLFRALGFSSLLGEFGNEQAADVGDPDPTLAPGAHEAVLSRKKLGEAAAACRSASRIALVVEADGGDPLRAGLVGIALACGPAEGAYVPLAHDYLGVPQQLSLEVVREALGPLLSDPGVEKVGHDVKAAAHLLRRHGLPVQGWALDTKVAAFLLNPSRTSYNPKRLAAEFLGRATADGEAADAPPPRGPSEIEIDTMTVQAGERAALTLALAERLRERLEAARLLELYETIDGPLLPLLADMEALGIRVDTGLLERMSGEMQLALDRIRTEIHQLAGVEFNIDSPKQLREVLFERLGLKPRRKTAKSRAASTDAQTLEELASEHAIARKIRDYRELAKLKGTYVDSLPRLVHPETGRVHTSYHPTGAATGRLSSSDPNLQNIPVRTETGRKIRAAFVPDEGYVFLASDYSQIELRILAHMAGDPELIAAFKAGQDIHRHTAAKVFEVHPDLVSDTMRRRAKAINFGILYGMSEARLAREQEMSRGEARRFITTYFARFAMVRQYIEVVREQARRDAAVRTLFGRVRLFPQLHQQVNRAAQEQALRAAVNTTLQGTAADLMKLAMLRVARELEQMNRRARMLLQVHDELLLEVPEDSVDAVRGRVRDAMEKVHPLDVPLVVDQKVGKSWLEAT